MINLDKTAANRESRRRGVRRVRRVWERFRGGISRGETSLLLPRFARSRSLFISRSTVLGVVGIFEGWGDGGGGGGGSDASYVGAIKRASKEEAEESGGVWDWRHSMTSSRVVQRARGCHANREIASSLYFSSRICYSIRISLRNVLHRSNTSR